MRASQENGRCFSQVRTSDGSSGGAAACQEVSDRGGHHRSQRAHASAHLCRLPCDPGHLSAHSVGSARTQQSQDDLDLCAAGAGDGEA